MIQGIEYPLSGHNTKWVTTTSHLYILLFVYSCQQQLHVLTVLALWLSCQNYSKQQSTGHCTVNTILPFSLSLALQVVPTILITLLPNLGQILTQQTLWHPGLCGQFLDMLVPLLKPSSNDGFHLCPGAHHT